MDSPTPGNNSQLKSGETKKKMSLSEMIRSPRRALRENLTLVKFLFVGLSGVVVNVGLLALQERIFNIGEGDPRLLIANAIAVETSIINNFLWNDHYTFGHVRRASNPGIRVKLARLGRYNLVSLGTFAVNETIFFVLTQRFVFNSILSSCIAIAVSFVANYFGSSRWAWKHKGEDRSVASTVRFEPTS
jgi:dolichol-phosphate mannosyltransferase